MGTNYNKSELIFSLWKMPNKKKNKFILRTEDTVPKSRPK